MRTDEATTYEAELSKHLAPSQVSTAYAGFLSLPSTLKINTIITELNRPCKALPPFPWEGSDCQHWDPEVWQWLIENLKGAVGEVIDEFRPREGNTGTPDEFNLLNRESLVSKIVYLRERSGNNFHNDLMELLDFWEFDNGEAEQFADRLYYFMSPKVADEHGEKSVYATSEGVLSTKLGFSVRGSGNGPISIENLVVEDNKTDLIGRTYAERGFPLGFLSTPHDLADFIPVTDKMVSVHNYDGQAFLVANLPVVTRIDYGGEMVTYLNQGEPNTVIRIEQEASSGGYSTDVTKMTNREAMWEIIGRDMDQINNLLKGNG